MAPDGRDLGVGYGYVTVTMPDGSTAEVGCAESCSNGSGSWYLPAGSTVSLVATPDRDSTFRAWTGSGSGCASSQSCQVTLISDTTVYADFGVKTYVLTVDNQNTAEGAVTNSGDTFIDCGYDGGQVRSTCSEVERAYDADVDLTITSADPAADNTFYEIDTMSCGSGTQNGSRNAFHAECNFANTANNTTLTVSWKPEPSGTA